MNSASQRTSERQEVFVQLKQRVEKISFHERVFSANLSKTPLRPNQIEKQFHRQNDRLWQHMLQYYFSMQRCFMIGFWRRPVNNAYLPTFMICQHPDIIWTKKTHDPLWTVLPIVQLRTMHKVISSDQYKNLFLEIGLWSTAHETMHRFSVWLQIML